MWGITYLVRSASACICLLLFIDDEKSSCSAASWLLLLLLITSLSFSLFSTLSTDNGFTLSWRLESFGCFKLQIELRLLANPSRSILPELRFEASSLSFVLIAWGEDCALNSSLIYYKLINFLISSSIVNFFERRLFFMSVLKARFSCSTSSSWCTFVYTPSKILLVLASHFLSWSSLKWRLTML